MNFNLSEEQNLIRDSIERFVADNYEFSQRNAVVAMEHGFSAEHWQQFAELGWDRTRYLSSWHRIQFP